MAEDDQTESETKAPRTRGTRPTDRQTMAPTATPGAAPQQGGGMWGGQRMMPWNRPQEGGQGGGWGPPQQPGQGQPMQGGHPGFGWGGMGGQGQGGMPNWQALAQQFQQRFAQNNPFLQHLGMSGQGQTPPGQAPAAPMPGQAQPGRTPPIYAGAEAAQGQPQLGAAPQGQGQGGPFQDQIGRLAQMFGRQQPGGIVGPGQGPQQY